MLYAIPNLSASRTVECAPWETTTTAPPREHWNEPDVKHTFYSGFEGLIAGVRIDSKDNPAIKLHWLVVDYDSKIDDHERAAVLGRCADFKPQYICRTSSGGARLLWKLAEPFPLHNNDLTKKLLSHVRRKLRLGKLLAGLDKSAFEDPCKYYEAGTDWKRLSDDEIPAEFMMLWSMEASKSYAWKKLGPVIPMDVLADEVERQYPGRWQGPFESGERGIRFWDSSADNETAAIIRESGMQCFTGGWAFVPWAHILGRTFVNQYEADRIGGSIADVYFDGRDYWMQLPDGRWESYCKSDMAMILKVDRGLSGHIARGDNYSEVEQALTRVMQNQNITCASPLVHRPKGIVQVGKHRVLNTSSVSVLQPATDEEYIQASQGRASCPSAPPSAPQPSNSPSADPAPLRETIPSAPTGGTGSIPSTTPVPELSAVGCPLSSAPFPWIRDFFTGFFDPPEQLDYFYAWLRRWYESALEGRMRPGQASFFAGVPNTGKTLLSTVILSRIFGGHIDASSFLSGEDSFNSHLFGSAVWAVDDVVPLTDNRSHMKFSALIKKMAANRTFSVREKYRVDKLIEWNGRVVVTCNTDPESIRILPDVDLSNRDKINLFRVSERDTFVFPHDVEATIVAELPFFLRWLLDWEPPDHVVGDTRYGVRTYCEESLFEAARHSSSAYSFLEVLLKFFE
ncbi:MAG TPA: primase-helicase family protein, partial [Pontiella sp.]|nr:primase-helicase family protein [Pontiella sp.]